MVDESLSGYSINRRKYLQVFFALCRNSKKIDKQKQRLRFEAGLISKKIEELEKTPHAGKDFDWIRKRVPSHDNLFTKQVVVVKDKPKIDKKSRKKEIDELKKHILEAKKQHQLLKKKGISEKSLKILKERISQMEEQLKAFR